MMPLNAICRFWRCTTRISTRGPFGRLSRLASSRASMQDQQPPKVHLNDGSASWSSALSMGATALCFAHCTLLPIALAGLPLLTAAVPADAQALVHDVLHATSVLFVVPVGSYAVYHHYQSHGRVEVSSLGFGGLTTIAATYGPCVFSSLPHMVPHEYHQIIAGAGCLALLGSQFWSRRIIRLSSTIPDSAATCCSTAAQGVSGADAGTTELKSSGEPGFNETDAQSDARKQREGAAAESCCRQ